MQKDHRVLQEEWGGEEPPNKMKNMNSPSPNHSSDLEMVDRGVDMEWEQTITVTPEQAIRLILMKEKAIRLRKSRLKWRVLLEGHLRKQEKESN